MSRSIPRERWSDEMDRFTRRNAGRRTVLEVVVEGTAGARRIVESRLWGVACDDRDGAIDFMFGDFDEGRDQMTHSIGVPMELETVAYPDGSDRLLRVVHEGGETLLHVDRPRRAAPGTDPRRAPERRSPYPCPTGGGSC